MALRHLHILDQPIVGIVVTISPSLSLYRMVVFPAASRPTINILMSSLENKLLNKLAKAPILQYFSLALVTKQKVADIILQIHQKQTPKACNITISISKLHKQCFFTHTQKYVIFVTINIQSAASVHTNVILQHM